MPCGPATRWWRRIRLMTTELLSVREIHVGYGAVRALEGVSIHVDEGEVVSVIGSNGAGKTTLMKTIAGLLDPGSGAITFGGLDITGIEAQHLVGRGISLVPEGRQVFGRMSVEENLILGAYMGVVAGPRQQSGQRCETIVHRAPVGRHAVATRIQPRDHRAPAGRADLVRRQVVVEADAARRNRVDVRRSRDGVAVAAEAVGALLIGAEDDEVGAIVHADDSMGDLGRPIDSIAPAAAPGHRSVVGHVLVGSESTSSCPDRATVLHPRRGGNLEGSSMPTVPPTAAGQGSPRSLRSAVARSPHDWSPSVVTHAQPCASEISLAFVSVVRPAERGASK